MYVYLADTDILNTIENKHDINRAIIAVIVIGIIC